MAARIDARHQSGRAMVRRGAHPRRMASRCRVAFAIVGLEVMIALTGAGAAMAAEGSTNGTLCIENASLAELQQALAEARTTSSALARAYLARIEAYDRAGPTLNSVREINPDALADRKSVV